MEAFESGGGIFFHMAFGPRGFIAVLSWPGGFFHPLVFHGFLKVARSVQSLLRTRTPIPDRPGKECVAMENSIYLGLSRQITLQTNLDIVANNIANVNTSGYRAQSPMFEEYLTDPRGNGDPLSFVLDYGQFSSTAPGPMTQTGNSFNVALNGPGFLTVQLPDGTLAYTRDGDFQKNQQGQLLTSSGYPVVGAGGPITVPSDSTEFVVDERGVISDQTGQIGRLNIVEFENLQSLKPTGGNAYTSKDQPIEAEKTTVAQGFLEGSNVQPVVETTRMIKILRQFQSVQRMLEAEHERQRTAIQRLTGGQ